MRKLLISCFVLLLISCKEKGNTVNKNEEVDIESVKKDVEKYLNEVNYGTDIAVYNGDIYIQAKSDYSDRYSANSAVVDYVIYRYFSDHKQLNIIPHLVIIFEGSRIISELRMNPVIQELMENALYWEFISYGIRNFTISDDVYYELTRDVLYKMGEITFKDELFQLIRGIGKKEKASIVHFIYFYNWSDIEYSDEVTFDKSKLNFYIDKLGYGADKDRIDYEYADSLNQLLLENKF